MANLRIDPGRPGGVPIVNTIDAGVVPCAGLRRARWRQSRRRAKTGASNERRPLGLRPWPSSVLVGRTGFEPVTNGLKAGPGHQFTVLHNTQQQCFHQLSTGDLLHKAVDNCRLSPLVVPKMCHRGRTGQSDHVDFSAGSSPTTVRSCGFSAPTLTQTIRFSFSRVR